MDLLRTSNAGSVAPVLEWRIEDAEPDQGSVTSRLTKQCVSVFRKAMKKLPKETAMSQETFRRLERSCSSLILWDSGYDVAKGGLDDVLEKSRTLHRSALGHLINISTALADGLPYLINHLKDEELGPYRALSSTAAEAMTSMHEGYQDGSDTDNSDSDSSIPFSSDWDELAEDIWTDVQCLLDLDALIKSPAPDIVQVSRDNQKASVEWKPHVVYTDRIRARFPRADPSLADRLGRANWERFLKGNADREKNEKGGFESSGIDAAGTIADCTEPVSKFHDSGLGTSINTGSAYAETVMSYRREGGQSVQIPPLPKEAKQGKPFECVACGRKLVITDSSAWKKHLYMDLCPWMCHELDCTYGTQPFRNQEGWIQHLGLEHGLYPEWKSFACPICHENTGNGKIAITRHLSNHMEEISLAALPAGIEMDDESDSYSDDTSATSHDGPPPGPSNPSPPLQPAMSAIVSDPPLHSPARPGGEDGHRRAYQSKWDAYQADEKRYKVEKKWDRFPKGSRVYIGNLPWGKATKRDVFDLFHHYGRVAKISFELAYGVVQYHTLEEAQAAVESLQGADLKGRKIHLEFSRNEKKKSKNELATPKSEFFRPEKETKDELVSKDELATHKSVTFELLLTDSPQSRARLPMRVRIYPHDTADAIVKTIRNFYGIYSDPTSSKGIKFEDEQGNTLMARYEDFQNNTVVYVRVIEEPLAKTRIVSAAPAHMDEARRSTRAGYKFDLIVCTNVLAHIGPHTHQQLITEWAEYLNPGGGHMLIPRPDYSDATDVDVQGSVMGPVKSQHGLIEDGTSYSSPNMAGLHLVPIPIAVTLISFAIIATPFIPAVWVWITVTGISQLIRRQEQPWQVAKTIGRWIGLSVILPWVAILILCLMVVAQVLLTPLFLVHQLRDLRETITWFFIHLDLAQRLDSIPTPTPNSTPIDTSSLPPYTFTPLPSTSPTAMRLLTIHPDTPIAPIRGTISTTTLSSSPTYDALSYTRPTTTTSTPTPHNHHNNTLLLLTTPNPPTAPQASTTTWATLPLPPPCAAALRRLRHPTKPRRVWVDAVCVNRADAAEKSRQVAALDEIYCAARRVVVDVGERGEGSDGLLEWVNGLPLGEVVGEGREGSLLGVGAGVGGRENGGGMQRGVGRVFREWVGRVGGEVMQQRADEVMGGLERVARVWRRRGARAWEIAQEQYRVAVLGLAPVERARPPEDLEAVLSAFFERLWFKQLWPLQEVALPELARVRFMCGDKTTTGARIAHLSKLDQGKGWDVGRLSRLAPSTGTHGKQKHSCLLDILLETQHLQCEDPRDKIFAVLNIAKRLDKAAFAPWYSPDYGQTVAQVYATYSSLFIKSHGLGFILALIKSPPNVQGLPSWSTDWTVPWPDQRALVDMESPRLPRTANEKDDGLQFDVGEDGQLVMTLVRPRVVRGFFARDGALTGTMRSIENVRQLRMDEVLVEVHPGLALLLRQKKGKPEHYSFSRVCPHALTREGVEKAVANWRSVVLQESADPLGAGPSPKGYLSLPGVYKIM
ncbi:uncharacterized protein B0H64DRAFT_446673 [Chaetomium fimeti]|uniref:RRM domain-containing protein n=1 Tax=Chaetomium fimeti TaxID=1854472 RepID=A0AAE0LMR6_9PEZI|nr:hypothetical protein B0H64DRAFT_446673 [Chaetomium fimeti]